MKKLLVSLALLSVLIGIVGVLAANQGLEVTIGEDINLVISPTTVNFSSVTPGTNDNPATNGPITFDATDSNVDVTIEVASVTGFPFETGLMLDTAAPVGQSWTLPCVLSGDVCTYTTASTVPTLNVPIAAPQSTNTGTITYTVSGPTP